MKSLPTLPDSTGSTTTVNEARLQNEMQEMDCNVTGNSTLTKASWAKVYGTKYMPGSVIVINLHYGFPVIAAQQHPKKFQYAVVLTTFMATPAFS
ncbi:hypothetical protein AC249_AIPGENE10220 [Exaiptasia diaphana]|nr:hypothetical protein AC249_AIPGENE10220 [Exaiptasia diaphana]